MRKFLLIALAFMALPVFAQNNYQFRISSFMSEDGSVSTTYNYAEPTGTDLRSIHNVDFVDPSFPYEGIDSLQYDNNGNITKLATNQLLNGQYQLVCFVDYTYNELNLRATRKNYNVWDGEIPTSPDGIITYFYDENNKLIREEQFFWSAVDQITEYTYNTDGLLESMVIQRDPNWPPTGNYYENSMKLEYFYDDNNNLVETLNYTWTLEINDWDLEAIELREYDEVGNCTSVTTTSASGTPQVKYVYKYDEKVLAKDIYFYPNPEGDFPPLPQMHNMVTSYEFWAQDMNGAGLVYVIDYLFNYDLIGEASLNVIAEASHDTICIGEKLTLEAKVSGGTGDYTFSWTPAETLNDATLQSPEAIINEEGTYTFTVTVDDGIDVVESTVTVVAVDCTNIEEQTLNNVSIYPNPAQDFIMINSENVEFVEIIDIYGRVIAASEIKGETRIEMSNFADGIYYVRLHSNGATAIQKVVKN